MKKLSVISISIVLFFCGCNEKQIKNLTGAHTSIEIDNPVSLSIEDFVIDIDTIRLETSDESIITSILNMHIMNNRFYILTNNFSSVYIFDFNGKFISKISDRGDGPNEYIRITSFEVDKINRNIIISDNFSRRIFIYDQDGSQIETIPLDFQPIVILPHPNGFLNIYSGPRDIYNIPEMENYNVHFLNSRGKFISSAIEVTTPKRIDIGSAFMADCLANGDILFQPVLSEIIYKIEGENIIPLYSFSNLSRFKFLTLKEKMNFQYVFAKENSLEEKEEQGYLLTWGGVRDLDSSVFFSFSGWKKRYYLYYSKSLNKALLIDPEEMRGNKALTDIYLNYPKAVDGNKFYISPDPGLIDIVKNKLPEGIIKMFFEKTDFDSNPILISFSIKFPGE
jgi:hypothetical protein